MARSIDTATVIRNGTGSTIDSDLIGDNIITSAKIAAGAITAEKLNVGQIGGRRNLIINGGMQVSQRYGTNRTFVTANQSGYTLDRWNPGQFQQAGHQQVSVTDSSVPTTKAVRVSSSSTSESGSGTRMAFGQMVEHANCDFVAGRTVTLSFWIKFKSASITGINGTNPGDFVMQLSEYDTVDPDFGITGADRTNGTYISNGSFPTTWTKYTQTVTCASTVKNIGARFLFVNQFYTQNIGDEWYEITAVQLELGDTATPFEHRSYGEELALCQRYYINLLPNVAMGGHTKTQASNKVFASQSLPHTMRTTPTVSVTGQMEYYTGSVWSLQNVTVETTSIHSISWSMPVGTNSYPPDHSSAWNIGTNNQTFNCDAEL